MFTTAGDTRAATASTALSSEINADTLLSSIGAGDEIIAA
jgi:hypothetical protein